jgi:hypothetical protein
VSNGDAYQGIPESAAALSASLTYFPISSGSFKGSTLRTSFRIRAKSQNGQELKNNIQRYFFRYDRKTSDDTNNWNAALRTWARAWQAEWSSILAGSCGACAVTVTVSTELTVNYYITYVHAKSRFSWLRISSCERLWTRHWTFITGGEFRYLPADWKYTTGIKISNDKIK